MNPRRQAALTGAVTGSAVFLTFFYLWTKTKKHDFEQIGQDASPAIAEQAVKDYISTKYGLTPARLQSFMARVTQIQTIVNAIPRTTTSAR